MKDPTPIDKEDFNDLYNQTDMIQNPKDILRVHFSTLLPL